MVEYRLAKARVAGSNPVSCLHILFFITCKHTDFENRLKKGPGYVIIFFMHEWLSGGVSPCQGEGRGFEYRLVLVCFVFVVFNKATINFLGFIILLYAILDFFLPFIFGFCVFDMILIWLCTRRYLFR